NLAAHGLGVRPDYSYARVLDGFSAVLDPRAQALLEQDPEVVGVYPVRAAFPATVSSSELIPVVAPPPVALRGYDGRGVEIALLDRAVDPNADGATHDAARIALIGVTEPYAAFADSPEALAVDGAFDLDMLVVVPAGNEGRAGPSYGSLDGPAGATRALTVAAIDPRPVTASVHLSVYHGL